MHVGITLETQCCSPLCSISNQFEFSDCSKIHLGCDMPLWHAAGVSIFSQYCQYCDMQQVWVFSKTKLNGESSPTCGGLTKAVAAMLQYLHLDCVCYYSANIHNIYIQNVLLFSQYHNIYIQNVLLSGHSGIQSVFQFSQYLHSECVTIRPISTIFILFVQ